MSIALTQLNADESAQINTAHIAEYAKRIVELERRTSLLEQHIRKLEKAMDNELAQINIARFSGHSGDGAELGTIALPKAQAIDVSFTVYDWYVLLSILGDAMKIINRDISQAVRLYEAIATQLSDVPVHVNIEQD